MSREAWRVLWERHRGKLSGALVGFGFGLLLMRVGLFWAVVIAALTAGGFLIGSRMDDNQESLAELLEKILQGRR